MSVSTVEKQEQSWMSTVTVFIFKVQIQERQERITVFVTSYTNVFSQFSTDRINAFSLY